MAEQKVEEMQGAVHKVFVGAKPRPRPNQEKSKCCFHCGKENHAAENCFLEIKSVTHAIGKAMLAHNATSLVIGKVRKRVEKVVKKITGMEKSKWRRR